MSQQTPAASERVIQLGFVVEDLKAACAQWTREHGVGPFFLWEHVAHGDYTYRGAASGPDLSIALSYWGETQIELIQQHNQEPSPHLDFLRERGPGMNHVGLLVDDYGDAIKERARRGQEPVVRSASPGLTEYVFYHGGDWSCPATEIVNVTDYPRIRRLWDDMLAETQRWDGESEPLRGIETLLQEHE